MQSSIRTGLAVSLLALACAAGRTQEPIAVPKIPVTPPPATAVAAVVNSQNIPELAIYRALLAIPAERREQARPEILGFLIDNTLSDQYLAQLKIPVDPKDVEARFKEIEAESNNKDPKGFEKMMHALVLTEADLRVQIANELRFDRFVEQQGTDKALRDLFERNRVMFDGTMMRARHILLTPPAGNAKAAEEAKSNLLAMRKQIEEAAVKETAKLGAGADNLAREKARMKALDDAFADFATRESACPSKKNGGSLPWFPRMGAGAMVEPFARAAFALKPYEMSDVVTTQFGLHLILAVEVKPGREVKFEDVREFVKDVFADRLHEAIVARMRPTAQITVTPPAKQ